MSSAPGSDAACTGTHSVATGIACRMRSAARYASGLPRSKKKTGPSWATGDPTYPWMSQPSAARAASMTASDSVGWPWMIRATSL